MIIARAQKENSGIRSGIAGLMDKKMMWDITDGRAALLISNKIITKQWCGVTQWEAWRGTNILIRTNDGVFSSKKNVALT